MKWQPIETAPKPDCLGPRLIVATAKGRVDLAHWDDESEPAGWYSATNHNGYEAEPLEPTHWMPLPEPPAK